MFNVLSDLNPIAIGLATLACTMLGGVWFAALVPKQYALALGRDPSVKPTMTPLSFAGLTPTQRHARAARARDRFPSVPEKSCCDELIVRAATEEAEPLRIATIVTKGEIGERAQG